MAQASRLPPESSLELEPRPPSFLQSALGLLRGASRTPREAGPTIRVMFAPTRAGRSARDAEAADVQDDPRAMRRALKAELNRVSGSRYVLRHLAKIEHDLKVHGLDLFDRLPLRVLEKASAQLESLVVSPVTPGVAALRSRMAVAMLARERIERPAGRPSRAPLDMPSAARNPDAPGHPTPAPKADVPPAARPAPPDDAAGDAEVRHSSGSTRRGAATAASLSAMSAWGGEDHLEVRESSFADFEQASTEWQLLDEPRQT
jgi:hypothetical protein